MAFASCSASAQQLYHEKQHLQFCLLHTLNNLFQGQDPFSKAELDSIANGLSDMVTWNPLSLLFKPHHNTITGNYDVNVLLAAVQSRGKDVIWYDRRKGAGSLDLSYGNKLVGIVMNFPTKRYGGLWRGRHWVAIRKVQDIWYNLDSDLSAPQAFLSGEQDVRRFLEQSFSNGSEAFIVLEV